MALADTKVAGIKVFLRCYVDRVSSYRGKDKPESSLNGNAWILVGKSGFVESTAVYQYFKIGEVFFVFL